MNDEEEEKKRRRFDPAMLNPPKKFDPAMVGVVGQMLGGLGSGIGQGLASKMNERTMLAAAAMQGLIASDESGEWNYDGLASVAVRFADAVLARLDEVPDPRNVKAKERLDSAASIGVVQP